MCAKQLTDVVLYFVSILLLLIYPSIAIVLFVFPTEVGVLLLHAITLIKHLASPLDAIYENKMTHFNFYRIIFHNNNIIIIHLCLCQISRADTHYTGKSKLLLVTQLVLLILFHMTQ